MDKNRDNQEMKATSEESKHRYGYRHITWELRRHGLLVNHKNM